MGLGDVTRAEHQRGVATGREQRGFGPEVHRVADRQLQCVGHVARQQAAVLGFGDVTGRQAGTTEGFGEQCRFRFGETGKGRQQAINVHRRQRAEAEPHFGGRGNHVGLDPALDAADVETQAGEAAEARRGQRFHMVQRTVAPAHGLMQCAGGRILLARGMPGATGELHQHRADAPVRQYGFAHGRLGHQHCFIRNATGQKRGDAARIVGFLVAGEQECSVSVAGIGRGHQCGGGALDVTHAEADHAVVQAAHHVRVGTPVRRVRHGIQVHVEQVLRRTAHRIQADRTGAMVDHLDVEPGQVRTQVIEDATGGDRTRRVAGVEGHQGLQMRDRLFKHESKILQYNVYRLEESPLDAQGGAPTARGLGGMRGRRACNSIAQRLTCAYSVELMPNSLMKPSASSTPQSADCA